MRVHRYVPTRWTLDREFLDLPLDTRALLYGIWTWPDTPTHGLTITDPLSIAQALGIRARRAAHCLAELEQAGFIERDPDSSVTWIKEYWPAQVGANPPNSKHRKATAAALKALPETPMIARFRKEYGLTDRVCHRVSDRLSHTLADARSLPGPSPSDPLRVVGHGGAGR